MDLKDKLVTHLKIHFLDFALIEGYGSKRHIINFGVVEITIDKGSPYKSSIHKVALVENAPLKIGMVQDVPSVGLMDIGFI